jgi:hypothetical protein
MPRPQLEAPRLHLERATDREGCPKIAWCANYWRGGVPVQGWWWRESKESIHPQAARNVRKGKKRQFPTY